MINLVLNGTTIKADIISFEERLKYSDVLHYEGSDDDWEIFSINGGNCYVAYQQA